MTPPHLWIISRKHPPAVGGMEELSYRVARELAAQRTVTVVALRRSQAWLPLFFVWAAMRLLSGLVRGQVSVVLLGDPVLAALAVLARVFGKPVAVVVHGLDILWPNAAYQAYLRAFFFGRMSAYICISTHVRDALIASSSAPLARLVVIPGGVVDPPPARPADVAGEPVLLLVGRLVPRKGALWFVEAVLPALVRTFPDLRLVIAGNGPCIERIRRRANEAGIARNIVIVGAVTDEQKWALLARCTAVIVPNLAVRGDVEGFGLVAIEAGAAGKCVFASDLEGLRDAVVEGVNGRRLPAADASAWIASLTSALRDPDELRACGTRGRDHVRAQHAWAVIAQRYARLIDELAPAQ